MYIKSFFFLNAFCTLIFCLNPFVEGNAYYGKCANRECSEPISEGVTIMQYSSPDDSRISVVPNEVVLIYVKDYGPKKDLWGVIVRGARGYISKQFIRETRVYNRNLHEAVFEFKTSTLVENNSASNSQLHKSTTLQPAGSSVVSQAAQHSILPGLSSSMSSSLPQGHDVSPPSFDTQEQWNSYSGSFEDSHLSESLNPSHSLHHEHPHSHLDQSAPMHNNPELSSQFHAESRNILSRSHMTGMMSENILSSPTIRPVMRHSSPDLNHDPLMTSFDQNLVDNIPNGNFDPSFSPQSFTAMNQHPSGVSNLNNHKQNFHPSFASSSQNLHVISQIPSSVQHQHVHSPNFQEMYPSSHSHSAQIVNQHTSSIHQQQAESLNMYDVPSSDDYNDDFSRTMAMLKIRGMDNTNMYPNQEPPIHQSSQFSLSGLNYNSATSHSEHPQLQSDAAFIHVSGSVNPDSSQKFIGTKNHIGEDSMFHSTVNPGVHENIKNEVLNKENIPKINIIHKTPDSIATCEKDVLGHSVHEKFSEDFIEEMMAASTAEADEAIETLSADKLVPNSKDIVNDKNVFNVISPMSSPQVNSHESQRESTQSSFENVIVDSTVVNMAGKEHTTKQYLSNILTSEISLDTNSVHQKFSESATQTVSQSATAESATLQIKSSDSFISTNPHKEAVEVTVEAFAKNFISDIPDTNNNNNNNNNNDYHSATDNSIYNKGHTTPTMNNFNVESEKISEIDKIINGMDIDGIDDLATYQGRKLNGEFGTTEEPQSDSDSIIDENNTQSGTDLYSSYGNWFEALKTVLDSIISWVPEPLYSALIDLQNKGISPRVPVFTVLCGFTCIFLIIPLLYIKEGSKENKLTALLAGVEKKAYTLSATNAVLEEKLETVQTEVVTLQASLIGEKSLFENVKTEFENQTEELENVKAELESCLEVIDALKDKENEYLTIIKEHEKEKECYLEHKDSLDKIIKDQENSIEILTNHLQESENKVQEIEKEKEHLLQMKMDYEEKLTQFDRNCKQLLQEAEVWDLRVKELNENVSAELAIKEDLTTTLNDKDEEIESLKELVETFKIFDEIEDPEEQAKTKEEKIQFLLNSVMMANQLKKEEEKIKLLGEQLEKEKSKVLEMEVELLEARSEIDKLKLSYNQALQDKAEAQTKLEVLTNYFKDKEIQLQKQLGAQEVVRQKTEKGAVSAERRVLLIEQENASYKSQVASMKQEMEETERTLRSQIAAQEKRAHENWIAARAAERNLETTKQEVTQLHQRLTLLEREQANWTNASRDEIIRPVPKRVPGVNDESGSHDMNTSERGMFPPPPLLDRLPPPPMMLPLDRPLPPLPPPGIPPMFLHRPPPPPPPLERHFRPQPWHMLPDPDYTSPPDFIPARESTPPRGRQSTITDGDPHTSSPLTTDTRDSRNSTPPHLLPDFHDVPPQPGRHFFPPPIGRSRFPMQPPYRRDGGPEPRKLDNPNDFNSNSRGSQQPPPPEQWQHSRV